MSTPDFFRSRLDAMIDLRHPLAVLARQLPWERIEKALAPKFEHQDRPARQEIVGDLLGEHAVEFGGGVSNAGRPRLSIRLMVSLLYLKNSFNLSDEELVQRWSENVQYQFFSGMEYYEPRLPCDATQIGRFRRAIGEEGLEQLLKSTIETALEIKAVKPAELERVIVDTTVQEKAIAHPVDSRLLEIARHKVVSAAKRAGIALKQTFAKEGKELRRRAGGYAHAKQFGRLKRTVKRQRTTLGIVMREVQRKSRAPDFVPDTAKAASDLGVWLERAERIRTQQRHDKNKLYALHAPEVECIGKGKARKPYEFGVKVSLAVTHKQGLMVGARSFPGNPYDGHILSAQIEQTTNLLQDLGRSPTQAIVDLGFRGVDADNPGVEIIHRGRYKTLTNQQRRWLKRRQAIEPMIGHAKSDNRMGRCWLQGALGDALHALSCAAGYNIRWLMRAILRLAAKRSSLALNGVALYVRVSTRAHKAPRSARCWRCARPSSGASPSPRRGSAGPFRSAVRQDEICRADYVFDVRLGVFTGGDIDPQRGHGADLWRFTDPDGSAAPETARGFGNFTNYGVRNMLRLNGGDELIVGTASGLTLEPSAGWELLRLTPSAVEPSRRR